MNERMDPREWFYDGFCGHCHWLGGAERSTVVLLFDIALLQLYTISVWVPFCLPPTTVLLQAKTRIYAMSRT
jgi:hypothetical protein